jgi:hypothetical protein
MENNMNWDRLFRSHLVCVLPAVALLVASAAPQSAQAQGQPALPPYMDLIVGGTAPSTADVARQNVLGLNSAMFELYGSAGRVVQRNLLAQHPVILGLFTGAGGRFILYRPGIAPVDAPSVPLVYQLLKSVGHSTMVLPVLVGPYIGKTGGQPWRTSLQTYRVRLQAALDSLDQTDMQPDWRAETRAILQENIAFADACLNSGINYATIKQFGERQGPRLKKIIAWAAETQVAHWMGVIADWKRQLGADWDKTYAASNTIYVARQNNILFSVLAQFFGPEAINQRLILIETISFTTTPEEMLDSLTRIVSDRTVGQLFFGNLYMMDYELMGSSARDAIVKETAKAGMTAFLPPLVPFGSKQWPALITPGPGPATLLQLP